MGMFSCFVDEEAERQEREAMIAKARAQAVVLPEENEALKGASVVGDATFNSASPWEEARREQARKEAEEARKARQAEAAAQRNTKRNASKEVNAGADRKRPAAAGAGNGMKMPTIFASFRQKFEDKARGAPAADAGAAGEDEIKPKSEYERPKTIKKENSVAVWSQRFDKGRVPTASTEYKSEYEKEKESLPTQTLEQRQAEIEKREAEKLMTDQFKVEVGLGKANYRAGAQPKGAKVRRLQHDLAGSTFHFAGVQKNPDFE